MLKNYELLYVVHPDLEGSTDKVTEKVAGFIAKIAGKITNQEDWGKRKLAYSIGKNGFGVYILVNFEAESGLVPQVENNLKLSEEIMRFMVVALPEVKQRSVKAKKAAKPAEKPVRPAGGEVKPEAKAEKPVKDSEPVESAEENPSTKAQDVPEKPKKAVAKKTEKKESDSAKATTDKEKPKKKVEKEGKAEEAERMKKLDEKLEQILGE